MIAVSTMIEADNALLLSFSWTLFTKGFNAAAKTNDANNIMNKLHSFGMSNNKTTVRIVKIIVFTLKNFFTINLFSLQISLIIIYVTKNDYYFQLLIMLYLLNIRLNS